MSAIYVVRQAESGPHTNMLDIWNSLHPNYILFFNDKYYKSHVSSFVLYFFYLRLFVFNATMLSLFTEVVITL